jgi:eukaryotic-like serine/threonine-protein kinase
MPNLPDLDDRLMSLCELALSLPAEERQACLRAAAGGDASLFDEVWSRVQWEERLGDFMLEPLVPRVDCDHRFAPGQILAGRFAIVREVAEGGMAVVYEAVDQKLDQRVAIKCPKTSFRRRLPPEARSALQVSHPNICRVFEVHAASTDDGEIDFLTMEFLEGETLLKRLQRKKKLPAAEVRSVAREICAGLEEAHRKGIIHGDLKTNNIVLAKSATGERAVITDFGLAKQITGSGAHSITRSSQLRGTPDFVAPELWQGHPNSVASDIYALGVILYEAMTGLRPGSGQPPQARFDRAPKPPHEAAFGVPAEWSRMTMRCLDVNPAARPENVAAVREVFDETAQPAKAWLAGTAALVLALIALVLVFRNEPPRTGSPSVRLALLPFESDGDSRMLASGVMQDVSNRLTRARRTGGLLIIPSNEAAQNKVGDPKMALAVLGATHSLQTSFRKSGEKLRVSATIWNAQADLRVGRLAADYGPAELAAVPKALLGAITASIKLRGALIPEVVTATAYGDYARGLSYLQGDLHDAGLAIPYFQRAAQLDPGSALPYAGIAEAQVKMFTATRDRKRIALADESLKAAEARNADALEVHLVAGLVKRAAGRLGEAVDELHRAVEQEPSNLDALRRLAGAYQALKLPDQALPIYRQVISLQPAYYKSHTDLGAFFYDRGEYANALPEFASAGRLAPAVAQTHHNLAAVLTKLGKYQEAEAAFREALRLQTTFESLAGLAAVLAYEKRHEESAALYEQSLKVGPATPLTVSNLGDSYRRCGRDDEARTAYKKALDLADQEMIEEANNRPARALAGYLSARLGDSVRAQREIRQAMGGSDVAADILRRVVLTFEALKDRNASIAVLRRSPKSVIDDLSRQPDLAELQQDSRFLDLVSQGQ